MSITEERLGPPRNQKLKGILAFLPDAAIAHYPYDGDVWKKNLVPYRIRKKRSRKISNPEPENVTVESMDLFQFTEGSSVVVVFLFDPNQPYCHRIRNHLVKICAYTQSTIRCIAISSSCENIDSFLQSTGFAFVPLTATLSMVLSLSQVPTVSVIFNGRKVSASHEEMALEWNDSKSIAECWLSGTSALSCAQQVSATLAFPSCVIL
jgi:hypothetical protein